MGCVSARVPRTCTPMRRRRTLLVATNAVAGS
jgi:hypothetical protein